MTTDSTVAALEARFGSALRIGTGCELAADLAVELDDDAVLVLGDRVTIRRGTTIQVHRGATVTIGNDVAIGEHTFISAMIGIRIGDGAALSNMVDLHDHNHPDRSVSHLRGGELTPGASGFTGAPIIIESGALIANKVSITAGVRIGQNTMVGAGSTLTRSVGPNRVAAGSPATVKRTFDALLRATETRPTISFAWYGTSIMQHFEGYNARMATQADLPDIGSTVTVEEWRNRGYVDRLHTTLQTRWPHLDIDFRNHGEGGATSRDIVQIVIDNARRHDPNNTVSVLGCGINDVWRGRQGRYAEAVDLNEFTTNYQQMLDLLTANSRQVICIGETPFGWDDTIDIDAANITLQQYNAAAAQLAAGNGAAFIDVWEAFVTTERQFTGGGQLSVWSDGIHLSPHGDALLHDLVDAHLQANDAVGRMVTYRLHECDEALQRYGPLFADLRGAAHTPANA
jgi:acetyltransferase-like isoleucine patch superfamily enzyme